jgi:hypothetical protein
MRRLTVLWNASATSCAGGGVSVASLCWLEGDERGRHTNPPLPSGLRPTLLHALTWNVFRTFELLPPAFWLRRLQARLHSALTLEAAPQIVRVELWRALPLPPAPRLIDPDRAEPVADILIETEHVMWTLMVRPDDRLEDHATGSDPVARLIDAGSWFAGTQRLPLWSGRVRSGARAGCHSAGPAVRPV